ncbi:putative ABC transporter, integral membrane protein [Lactobacillus plantarum subsp. plantarum ST-III] [Lactiplantibacillus plantarum]|uniref:ABC transporter, permease protein n=1 Tax=Lactiplantibacillus plantarum CMPG5300 TaxID=1304889 RepID=A0AAW3FN87_LACPN|nr:ABC transporter permease [Lactiplantibacillus plantarum]ATI71704.1 ABC transporter permease [Lactiplantibacillus plantarum]KGH42608.1 ABC transporter, permease protein [Lactiplantibacillus plantarum CMPG5300]MCZ2137332.1 ABC transporter permease [Lactiplantibacillus plantarum]MCZ2273922.1 ABC transporter permease [Lactiplantibacillus plantarum]NSL94804.1 ABC transporter permease [Lactiplantibacillus plantarum]
MLALIKRNYLLYFRNRSGVLLSLLSAAISFILYLVFLKQGMHRDWAQLPQANQLLDNWLISGTLALTGITTTLAGLNQLVWDRERQIQTDLLLTDAGPLQLQVSYLVSATIVGIVMQLLMFFGMWGYFNAADGLTISGSELLAVFGLIVVSAAFATLVNAVILKRVRAVDNLGKIATILGTAAGFLVGIYIPVGSLPSFAQTLVKLTPGSYVASLYRQALMSDTLNHVFNHQMTAQAHFERLMGIRLNWSGLLTTSQTYQIMGYIFLGCLLAVLIAPYRQRRRIQRLN